MSSSKSCHKGRGASSNPDNRFDPHRREAFNDGWDSSDEPSPTLATTVQPDAASSLINYIDSPDIPYDRSINPYRGCEHGCISCFARPSHAYLDLSPGLDFESRLFYKRNAAELLRRELSRASYQCRPITIGINTDAYQPIEKNLGVTRDILEVLYECRHPFSIVTKSALIERDLDLLSKLGAQNLVRVMVSVTTLDRTLSRRMEPRAAAPHRRLKLIERLVDAGVSTGVLFAPVIPFLNDNEMEDILAAVRNAGAVTANYVMLRMPHEVKQLFTDWLQTHYPLKAERILGRMRDMHGGQLYRAEFGKRLTGSGIYAELINRRFHNTMRSLEFPGVTTLDTRAFDPRRLSAQMDLFLTDDTPTPR